MTPATIPTACRKAQTYNSRSFRHLFPMTNFPTIHGRPLRKRTCFPSVFQFSLKDGPALLLRFRLHESRTAVVSSVVAETLRQLVKFLIDRAIIEEDRRMPSANERSVGNEEHPQLLQFNYPQELGSRTVESVITSYHELFRKVCLLPFTRPRSVCQQLS